MHYRNSGSIQLELKLLGAVTSQPWGGKSPRELTAGYRQSILKAQAVKSVSDDVDPEQYDFWLSIKRAPRIYRGAPLLVPLR